MILPSEVRPTHLLDIKKHEGAGYLPLVDYAGWRVALLNFDQNLRVTAINRMQRHNETDEVFVLLKGRCLLFTGAGADRVEQIYAEDLRPCLVYTVPCGVWHNHALSPDAQVLVVENRDTTYDNSPFAPLSAALREELLALARLFWGGEP